MILFYLLIDKTQENVTEGIGNKDQVLKCNSHLDTMISICKYRHTYIHTYIQTDGQTDGQTDKHDIMYRCNSLNICIQTKIYKV